MTILWASEVKRSIVELVVKQTSGGYTLTYNSLIWYFLILKSRLEPEVLLVHHLVGHHTALNSALRSEKESLRTSSLPGGLSAERNDVWILCPASGTFERDGRHCFTWCILKHIFSFPFCLHGFLAFSMHQWNGNMTRFSCLRVFSSLMWLTLSESIFIAHIFAVSRENSCFGSASTSYQHSATSLSTLCTGFQVRSRFLGCATSVLW